MPTPTGQGPVETGPSRPSETRSRWSACPPLTPRGYRWLAPSLDDEDYDTTFSASRPRRRQQQQQQLDEHQPEEQQAQPSTTSPELPVNVETDSGHESLTSQHHEAHWKLERSNETKHDRPLPSAMEPKPMARPSQTSSEDSMTYEISRTRLLPAFSSSFLRPGSKFRGDQKSNSQVYDVTVELKYVDLDQSFLCGFLRIQGLTKAHPTLTTYFEGEIVGDRYSFYTRHPEWGCNDRIDLHHWSRFGAWRPLAEPAKKPDFVLPNFTQKEHLFMRWKEMFVVPDYHLEMLSGASFDGFYYICFNQVSGVVRGIYFHARSEQVQRLELTHIPDQGCLGAMEFR